MKLSLAELKEFFDNDPALKRLNQKDLHDSEFAEILKTSFNEQVFDENLIKFLFTNFAERFNFNNHEETFNKNFLFEMSDDTKKVLFNSFKFFVVFKSLNLSLKEEENIELINIVTGTKAYQEEANQRINQLKNDLLKKYGPFNKHIEYHFSNFINSFNAELIENEQSYKALNDVEIFETNVLNSLIPKQGRPKDLLFNVFLLEINKLGDDLCPEDKYAKLIKPFFTFIAINYPHLIDLNDVNDTDKLRQRIIYLKSQQTPTVE